MPPPLPSPLVNTGTPLTNLLRIQSFDSYRPHQPILHVFQASPGSLGSEQLGCLTPFPIPSPLVNTGTPLTNLLQFQSFDSYRPHQPILHVFQASPGSLGGEQLGCLSPFPSPLVNTGTPLTNLLWIQSFDSYRPHQPILHVFQASPGSLGGEQLGCLSPFPSPPLPSPPPLVNTGTPLTNLLRIQSFDSYRPHQPILHVFQASPVSLGDEQLECLPPLPSPLL